MLTAKYTVAIMWSVPGGLHHQQTVDFWITEAAESRACLSPYSITETQVGISYSTQIIRAKRF